MKERRICVASLTYFFFFFEDFFAAFFFAGISESPPLGHALSVYRHTRVTNVNT